jgi:hypothetical protein
VFAASSQPLVHAISYTPLGRLLTPPRPSLAVTTAGSTRATSTGYGLTSRPSALGACWAMPVRRSGERSASVSPRTPTRSATSSTGCSCAPTKGKPSWKGCPPRCRRQPRSSSELSAATSNVGAARLQLRPAPATPPCRIPLQTLQPLPVRRATDHSMHLGARALTARACCDADLLHRAEAAGPLGGRRS